ncbi:hypothetical protein EHM92_00860 [bacterium]|nr:MAG: hypothetical protein EHM92_00860 [bacterium]
MQTNLLRITALGQGLYYVLTGLWPLVSMSTFLAVTGPKTDLWLVNTVGILVLVSGLVVFFAALRKAVTLEILLLAAGSALGLCAIDIIYVSIGRIDPIYLADATAEIVIVALYTASILRG